MGMHMKDPSGGEMAGMRVAVLGFGLTGREHAVRLRGAGCQVAIGVRPGGMSWVRARDDGFSAKPASVAVVGSNVVVVLVPDDEQHSVFWHAIAPEVRPGSLLVFGRGLALTTGPFEPAGVDVV